MGFRNSTAHWIGPAQTALILMLLLRLTLLIGCSSPTSGSTGGSTNNSGGGTPPGHLAVWSNTANGIPFTMVGTDPSTPGAGTTSIPVKIIPVSLNFSAAGVVISPDNPACGDTVSAVTRVVNSPLFTNNPWTDFTGTISVGNTQFGDAFQRMNFWAKVSSVSPDYHVLLQPVTVLPTISVDVPPGIGATLTPSPTCPSQLIGAIPSTLMDTAVQSTISAQKITADTLPVFLTYDISFVPENFLGYHNAQSGQTYIVASYIDIGFADPTVIASDVAVLSHEIGEWMNNPLLGNTVPAWGGFGIQPTCSSALEVGDPLSRNIFPMQTPGFTYHAQELAFAWWFTRNVPSFAINGQYSTFGTFPSPPPICQ
jgi:hypothetical protein